MKPIAAAQENFKTKVQRLPANVNKSVFIINQIVKASLSKTKLNILFSINPVWEKNIRVGFRFTRHRLTFSKFNDKNITENDLIIPLNISDVKYLSNHRGLIGHNLIPIPDMKTIQICDDKFLFYQTLKKNGFEKYLPKVNGDLEYPYILKKRIAEYGNDCYIITGAEKKNELKSLIADENYFCQQMIPGFKEYATHVLIKNGKIISALNIEYVFGKTTPIKGQDNFLYRKISGCPHLELFASMLMSINFEGLCCLNYKEIADQPYIFEINPRFGGSLSTFFFSFIKNLEPLHSEG